MAMQKLCGLKKKPQLQVRFSNESVNLPQGVRLLAKPCDA